jgi:hypothetical protein
MLTSRKMSNGISWRLGSLFQVLGLDMASLGPALAAVRAFFDVFAPVAPEGVEVDMGATKFLP